MFTSGYATIYVTDFNRAFEFYSKTLGLKVEMRAEDHWAELRTEDGFRIGLHPWTPKSRMPRPGTHGSINVGLGIEENIEKAVEILKTRGVKFKGPIVDDDPVRLAFFEDPDGNDLYLVWVNPEMA